MLVYLVYFVILFIPIGLIVLIFLMARIYFGAKNQQWEGVITGSGIDSGDMNPRKSRLANSRKFLIYVNKDDGSQTSWSVNYSDYREFKTGDRVRKEKGTLKVTKISV